MSLPFHNTLPQHCEDSFSSASILIFQISIRCLELPLITPPFFHFYLQNSSNRGQVPKNLAINTFVLLSTVAGSTCTRHCLLMFQF